MTKSLLAHIAKSLSSLKISENEAMKNHCYFKIGGNCTAMFFPKSENEISELLKILHSEGIKPLIIGNGSNLLVSDEGIDAYVIKICDGFDEISVLDNNEIYAQCGVTLAKLAVKAKNEGLSGLEFAHGIPGTLGGAICMNAGAYGGEMKDVILSARYIDGESGEIFEKEISELNLTYRHSFFSDRNDILLSAKMRLNPSNSEEISAKMRELSEKRRASQPLDKPSAGSTFKRPETGYAAAMIDECGLKGYSVGGAQVSPKHAGFVVNNGNASFEDVIKLMEHIEKTVLAEKGVKLTPEVKIIK